MKHLFWVKPNFKHQGHMKADGKGPWARGERDIHIREAYTHHEYKLDGAEGHMRAKVFPEFRGRTGHFWLWGSYKNLLEKVAFCLFG